MHLEDPVVAYTAESNTEAFLVQQFLQEAGIPASCTEDNSLAGYWFGGSLPEIHKPQVWISRRDTEAVARRLTEYEDRKRARLPQHAAEFPEKIETICFDCGQTTIFPGSLTGSVQECSHCLSWLDVGEDDEPFGDEWETAGSEEE